MKSDSAAVCYKGTAEQSHTVEVCTLADSVDLFVQLSNLLLHFLAVDAGIGSVGGLSSQGNHTVQHGVNLS